MKLGILPAMIVFQGNTCSWSVMIVYNFINKREGDRNMLFSEYYGIKYMDEADWFDPILTQDTRLFIDPFAVFKSQDDLFKDTYSEIMYFFQKAFEFIAHAGGNKNSLNYKIIILNQLI